MENLNVPNFLKQEEDSLFFNRDNAELQFFIPEMFFDRGFANVVGDIINVIGVFNYTIVDTKTGKNNGLHPFDFPTVFLTQPGDVEKIKRIKLTKTTPEEDYRVLKFTKGDKVVVSTKVPMEVSNAELFYKMFTTGKVPNTIPYSTIQLYFVENIDLTGNAYGMNYQMFGILAAELSRSQNNPKVLFRNTNYTDETDYRPISIKDAPRYVSAFTAINSEVKEEALANAIINSKDEKNHKYSPLERLFTGDPE